MEKIVNYVRNGKGVGLLFILAASVLVTIVFVLLAKGYYADARGQVLTVAGDFLPITVKSGVITDPLDTYKRVNIDFGQQGNPKDMFSVVLNTREDVSVSSGDAQGLYLLKDQIYVITPTQMRHYSLQDGFWNMERFEELMDDVVGVIFGSVSIVLIGILFLVCLVKTFFAAGLGLIVLKISGRNGLFDLSALMRLSAVLVAVLEVIRWAMTFLGIQLTGFGAFVIVVVLEMLFLFSDKKNEG